MVRNREGHYIIIKGTVQQEDITLVNIYGPKIEAPTYVGDFNALLTSVDRSSRQKINKETVALNDTLDQMDLIDIFRAFHPKAAEYTYFSSAHETFSRIDHML